MADEKKWYVCKYAGDIKSKTDPCEFDDISDAQMNAARFFKNQYEEEAGMISVMIDMEMMSDMKCREAYPDEIERDKRTRSGATPEKIERGHRRRMELERYLSEYEK